VNNAIGAEAAAVLRAIEVMDFAGIAASGSRKLDTSKNLSDFWPTHDSFLG
jgi:hypothetical protein